MTKLRTWAAAGMLASALWAAGGCVRAEIPDIPTGRRSDLTEEERQNKRLRKDIEDLREDNADLREDIAKLERKLRGG
jgi:hypothetical protein